METYQRLDSSFFQEPQELEGLINTDKLVQKFLPKQADIDRILKIIQRKVHSTPPMMKKKYTLLDSLLFKIVSTPEKEAALLAIPEISADKIITLYQSSLFEGHQGVIKTYLTISDKFFIPNLIHYL